ncbi:MAG: molybdopterin-guanine dinucleotide biosynthesis protein B [Promethearchaeota archaeon]
MSKQTKVIRLLGYSGSGKTHFILRAIQLLKQKLKMEVGVVKNIHDHEIDKPGKDSYKYSKMGAIYSVTRNSKNENTIFLKKDISIKEILNWLSKGPFEIGLIFIEGFKTLKYPTILCAKNCKELEIQYGEYEDVKMISGLISQHKTDCGSLGVPIVNIDKDFKTFLKLFNISKD